jgi:hypothetical protein
MKTKCLRSHHLRDRIVVDEAKGLQQTKRIGDIFSGAPSQPDAVFIVPQTAYTYFIRGNGNVI